MANKKVDLGCEQTRGTFILSGKVTGRFMNSFYSEGVGSNGAEWRRVHFGVEIEPRKTIYIDMFGAEQDNVYFSKTTHDANNKNHTETRAVKWADRRKSPKSLFGEDGFRMIGVTCGCKKITDKTGKQVNDTKYLTPFDACEEVMNLNDGDSVFIRGSIVYSTYNNKHRVSFEPSQISLMRKEIDFDAIDFQPNASFNQQIVYMGITNNEDNPEEYIVSAKIVNYSSIEDTEFYIRSSSLAKNFRGLRKYTHIKVNGEIVVDGELQEVTEREDGWGKQDRVERINSPFKRKLVIDGAAPETIDEEAYSEAVIEHAMEVAASIRNAKADYGKKDAKEESNGNWGKKSKGNLDDAEDYDMDLGL